MRRLAKASVVVSVGLLASLPLAARAYPRPDLLPSVCNGDGGVVRYKFLNTETTWEAAEKAAVANGFVAWEAVEDYLGVDLVDVAEDATNWETAVVRDPTPNGSTSVGYAHCNIGTDVIELRDDLTDAQFEHWGRHEMGHILTLHHTGTTDDIGGLVETMATCQNSTTTSLSQDDYGNLIHKHTPLSPATITANDGFEQSSPLQWWGTGSLASFTYSSSSPHSGTYAARFTPSTSGGYVYQTMNYAAAAGELVDARTWVRKTSSLSTSGSVPLEMWLFAFQRGVMVASRFQLGLPA